MKRAIYMLFVILPFAVNSQNMYNITDLFDDAPSGTARFMSMGGSMSALGGDLSVMGTNPAGTAVYRSNDINLTGIFDIVNNSAKYEKSVSPSGYNGAALGNLGFVVACEIEDSYLRFLNFGVNYRRKNNFRNNFAMEGPSGAFSQQYVFDYLYSLNPFDPTKINSGMYSGFDYNWLALLAHNTYVFDEEGYFYTPAKLGYSSVVRGGLNMCDFNLSANIDDRVYIGASLGYYNLDYSRSSYYYEDDEFDKRIYSLNNEYRISGAGYDFKLGLIVRPFEYSPFKISAFAHTPVMYRFMDRSSAYMTGPEGHVFDTAHEDCYGDDVYVTYRLNTPWKFGAGASYTFGRYLALNAEYEYSNVAGTSFTNGEGIDIAQNEEISYNLKAQHKVRIGAEVPLKKFALRAGYNYISSPFTADAYKCMSNATVVDTSTEYMNKYSKNVFTFGLGYTSKLLYIDFAYMCQKQKSDFYPFYDEDYVNPSAAVSTTSHSIVAAVGIRF